ncbi:MAG: SoxR reducing system RseC family protein [Deltaproteobacteria bacterium]|nr:SoxR reducing system RseC family protein [Deltaproteobacteria bacterium]
MMMAQQVTKTGVVKAVHGSMATAVTKREPECESCKAKGSCEAMGGTGANAKVTAINTANARVGDIVTIGMRSTSLLKASFFIYMVPILALLGGIIVGFLAARILPIQEEIAVGTLAGVGLVGSFVWLKKKAAKMAKSTEFTPEIVAIRPSSQAPTETGNTRR